MPIVEGLLYILTSLVTQTTPRASKRRSAQKMGLDGFVPVVWWGLILSNHFLLTGRIFDLSYMMIKQTIKVKGKSAVSGH